jgi:hypothetical protein
MDSEDTLAPASPGLPRWQRHLLSWLGPSVCGVALNQLADLIPHLVVVAALVLVAVMYGARRLDATAPLMKRLPTVLLRIALAGLTAAMLLPKSWAAPLICSLIVVFLIVALLTPHRGDLAALFLGIGVFTYGVGLTFYSLPPHPPGWLHVGFAGIGIGLASLGLQLVKRPQLVLPPSGITASSLRRLRHHAAEKGPFSFGPGGTVIALLGAIALTSDHQSPALVGGEILAMVVGLSLVSAEIVLSLPERHMAFFGISLNIGGASLTAIAALIACSAEGKDFILVPIVGAPGLLMATAGISSLDAVGALSRLNRGLKDMVKPESHHPAGHDMNRAPAAPAILVPPRTGLDETE